MIDTLNDRESFRRRRALAWKRNVAYWLHEPLRHVADVGNYITDRVAALCAASHNPLPTVLDVGFGSAWLLESLSSRRVNCAYVGVDNVETFVTDATQRYRGNPEVRFVLGDIEQTLDLRVQADVVVNCFNFFEIADLDQAMANSVAHLAPNGTLALSTIDKTYLILALSNNWDDFITNLDRFQQLPGTKYAFQAVDLGDDVSASLEYPSVLYSIQDYIDSAAHHGLHLHGYVEHVFTSKRVPKIYLHLEFKRSPRTFRTGE